MTQRRGGTIEAHSLSSCTRRVRSSLLSALLVFCLVNVALAQQLIVNRNFEAGPANWVLLGDFHASTGFPCPRDGSGYAYLSEADGDPGDNLVGTMYQQFTVPAGTTSAPLQFWYSITTQETSTTTAFDFLNVTIQDSGGSFLESVLFRSNLHGSSAPCAPYVRFNSLDLSKYAGQTIRLHFLGTTDGSLPTVFRIDDVSVVATVPPAVPGPFTLSSDPPVCDSDPPGPSPAVRLNWTSSSGAASYSVYRDGGLYASGITGLTYYNSANVVSGETYTYFVRAINSAGTRDSNTIMVSIPIGICPGDLPDIRVQPTSLTIDCGFGSNQPPDPVALGPTADRQERALSGAEPIVQRPQGGGDAERLPRPCTILMPPGQRSVYVAEIWPGGLVPYTFSSNVSVENRELAIAAMELLEAVANVDFMPRASQMDYLVIQDSTGNNSHVGRIGGPQIVNIYNWNYPFIMAHEFIHALGFWHEHQRSDRNLSVQINYAAVQAGQAQNFDIAPSGTPYGEYDFDSVMHYHRCALSVCCPAGSECDCLSVCETITVLPPNQEEWEDRIGQRDHLSTGDIQGLQFRYGSPIPSGDACFTIFNDGAGALEVISITRPSWATLVPPPPYSILSQSWLQVCVEPCGSCAGNDLDGDLVVHSNDPDDPSVIVSVHVNCPFTVVAPIIANISDASIQSPGSYTGPTPSLVQGTLPVDWSLVVGPPGMTIDQSNGVVFWPSATGVGSPHTITIRATNSADSDDETWLLTVTTSSAQWTVVNLHRDGATESRGLGVSAGQQVGTINQSINTRASMWSGMAASWVSLHPAGATWSEVNSVQGGHQVGRTRDDVSGAVHAALWSGTAASWVGLDPPGSIESIGFGVDGKQQVGWAYVGGHWHASLWSGTAASWQSLHPGAAVQSRAFAVEGGQQVGLAEVGGADHASLWMGTAASWADLHPGVATQSIAFGVNGGRQVGRATVNGDDRASLWTGTAASWVNLHPDAASFSTANSIFGNQQVGYAFVGGAYHASLWMDTAASWVDLHAFVPAEFANSRAQSIWSDTKVTYVVGYGFNTLTGRDEALLWSHVASVPCAADFNNDEVLNSADFFDFLTAFFNATPVADFNRDTLINSQDFFDFLAAFFAGC